MILLRNYRVLFRYTYIFGLAGILLLLLPFVPGLRIDDANAAVWVSLGGMFAFQPGELAKICLAIFFAGYLVRTRESLTSVGNASSSASPGRACASSDPCSWCGRSRSASS